MPLYEYACTECGHRFEILQPMGAGKEGLQCPACASTSLSKQFSTFSGSVADSASASPSTSGCCRGAPT